MPEPPRARRGADAHAGGRPAGCVPNAPGRCRRSPAPARCGRSRPGPARPDDLARVHVTRPMPRVAGRRTRSLHLQHRRADRHGDFREQRLDPASDHHADQFVGIGLGHRRVPTCSPSRSTVTRSASSEDLVHAVADVDDADAARPQRAHDREQPLHVMLGQRRGRLVHDQHAGVLRQRAQDLHALAVADRQRADHGVHVEVADVERGKQPARLAPHCAPVERARPARRRVAEEDVLGDRQLREQQQFLVDRRDPSRPRLERAGERGRHAVDQHGALVRRVHAGEHLDQRALAGTVLAEQRMDLAGPHLERHG